MSKTRKKFDWDRERAQDKRAAKHARKQKLNRAKEEERHQDYRMVGDFFGQAMGQY